MSRAYDVIDADGHVLEPFTLWNDYLEIMAGGAMKFYGLV